MASEGRMEPVGDGNFRVYDAVDQVIGAIETSDQGFQPLDASGDAGPVLPTAEEARDYLLESRT